MRKAILVGDGLHRNNIFDLKDPGNRDRCYEPYALLAARFHAQGITLCTPDHVDSDPAFELHMDVRPAVHAGTPAYLMLLETPLIRPVNAVLPASYRKVFTWNDSLVDGEHHIKINYPNPLSVPEVDGLDHRDRFCCLIAGNKAPTQHDPRELYSERVRVIRWYETHAPGEFDLYGVGWELPPARSGIAGKISRRLWQQARRLIPRTPFPAYRGKVDRKQDVLKRTRFSICYENMRDMPGYVTEKIFDCFFAGCVPIYWGADNIADHIPPDCFIDRRQFADTAAVHAHLKAMDATTYMGYQQRIAAFMASDAVQPFGAEVFAETIVSTVVQDLGRNT